MELLIFLALMYFVVGDMFAMARKNRERIEKENSGK